MESLTFREVMQLTPYQKHPFNTSIAWGSKGFRAEHDDAENKRVLSEAADYCGRQQKN
jgi:hypothetical protein